MPRSRLNRSMDVGEKDQVDDEWELDVQDEMLDPEVNDTGKRRKVSILNTQPKKRRDKKKKVSFGWPCIRIFGEPDAKPDAEPDVYCRDWAAEPDAEPYEEWIRVWTAEEMEEIERNKAATMIQKMYRGYRMREVYGLTLATRRLTHGYTWIPRRALLTEVESGNGQM
jgi:hypothetical protein